MDNLLENPCGHSIPDHEDTSYQSMNETFDAYESIIVTLNANNTMTYNHDDPFF